MLLVRMVPVPKFVLYYDDDEDDDGEVGRWYEEGHALATIVSLLTGSTVNDVPYVKKAICFVRIDR